MKSHSSYTDTLSVIAGLAHELDSPLKSIHLRTQKLINDYKNRDFEFISYKDFKLIISTLEKLERQMQYCSQTTSRMVYIGKRKAHLEKNNCQVNEIIQAVIKDVKVQLKSSEIKIITVLAKDLPLVNIGPVECHQVIDNAISNAIQSMPAGGHVKIKTLYDKKERKILLSIIDQGVGIPPEQLSKVFEPFYTTNERGIEKSAGLGLCIINAILNGVGGSIHIKSSLRSGTTLQIALPIFQ